MVSINIFRGTAARRLALPLVPVLLLVLAATAVRGQEDDILSFVPSGGRTLVLDLVDAGASMDTIKDAFSQERDAAGWQAWIDENRSSVPGLDAFDDFQARTLANYLAHAAPMDPAEVSAEALPRDGRDMALRYCQSCHIITVSITQDRTREAWLGTLNNPSHVEIEMNDRERSLLAGYYVVNGGIPIEQIPPALRAGGASY
jgi:mono/diheme cytochrome c family protein